MALIGFDAITAGGALGSAIGSSSGSGGLGTTSTAMQVDIDEAPKLIEGLKAAIEKLQDAYNEATGLATAKPPGKDPYSDSATSAIRSSAGGDVGGYAWANKEARKALKKTIENIEKSVAGYSRTDTDAKDTFTAKG
jgi:hypothetical protein